MNLELAAFMFVLLLAYYVQYVTIDTVNGEERVFAEKLISSSGKFVYYSCHALLYHCDRSRTVLNDFTR